MMFSPKASLLLLLVTTVVVFVLGSKSSNLLSDEDIQITTTSAKEKSSTSTNYSISSGAIVFKTKEPGKAWITNQEHLAEIGADSYHDSPCLSNAIVDKYSTPIKRGKDKFKKEEEKKNKKNAISIFLGHVIAKIFRKDKEASQRIILNGAKGHIPTKFSNNKKMNKKASRRTKNSRKNRNLGKKQDNIFGKKGDGVIGSSQQGKKCPFTTNQCTGCLTSTTGVRFCTAFSGPTTYSFPPYTGSLYYCSLYYTAIKSCIRKMTDKCQTPTIGDAYNGCSGITTTTSGDTTMFSSCTCEIYGQLTEVDDTSECAAFFDLFDSTCPVVTTRRKLGTSDDKYNDPPDLDLPFKKDKTMIGFVRVPKTGSTTLLKFFHLAERMYPWDRHLPSIEEEGAEEISLHKKRGVGNGVSGCIYGYAPSKAHLGTKNQTIWWNRCPHIPFGKMVAQWANTLPSWTPPNTTKVMTAIQRDDEPFTMTFQAVSILRDPFDRLVSYFYYLRKFKDSNQFLSHTVSEAQYERVKDNDLEGWMELLYQEDGGCGLELPYQYKYIHEDVNKAISLVKGDSPRVYTLLTECYEASLWLLAENFHGFELDTVERFINSEDYMSNSNYESSKGDRPSRDELLNLRSKAEFWFADDYKFYDAVVEQFKLKLTNSGVETSKLEACMHWKEVL